MNETDVRDLQKRLFKMFIEFMKRQDKITKVSDMVPGLQYVWVRSPDRIHTGRAILWKGVPLLNEMEGKKTDAQINVEISVSIDKPNNRYTHTRIWHHKKGAPFFQGWKEEE